MKKLKVGVIGAGAIAQMAHLPFYQNHPNVDLVALVDLNVDRAREIASKYNVKNIYSSAKEMFEHEVLDAVSICTTNNTHVPLAKLALQHGVNVLVEKPLATCLKEALELEDLASKTNKVCMIGMTHRFRNDTNAIKKIIDSGTLGEIYYGKARLLQRRNTPLGWFTDKSKSGGGPLMDIGVHVLDLAWWLSGQPEVKSVSGHLVKGIGNYATIMQDRWESAETTSSHTPFDVEDFASAFIRFKNGFVLQLEVSWAMNGHPDEGIKVDLFGTKGGISLQPLCFYSEQNQILSDTKLNVIPNNPYEAEINHFVHVVLSDQKPLIDIHQGINVMEMLEGISLSSMHQKEILIEDLMAAKKSI